MPKEIDWIIPYEETQRIKEEDFTITRSKRLKKNEFDSYKV